MPLNKVEIGQGLVDISDSDDDSEALFQHNQNDGTQNDELSLMLPNSPKKSFNKDLSILSKSSLTKKPVPKHIIRANVRRLANTKTGTKAF